MKSVRNGFIIEKSKNSSEPFQNPLHGFGGGVGFVFGGVPAVVAELIDHYLIGREIEDAAWSAAEMLLQGVDGKQ